MLKYERQGNKVLPFFFYVKGSFMTVATAL